MSSSFSSGKTYLYVAAGYAALHAALFTFKAKDLVKESFGEEEAEKKPTVVMHEVIGSFFGMTAVTTFMLGRGHAAEHAVHCGMSVLPLRMAYDHFVNKVTPPVPAIVLTSGIVGYGAYVTKKH